MRFLSLGAALLLVAHGTLPAQLGAQSEDAALALPRPLFTRVDSFSIPFTVDANTAPAREIRLYVSEDLGAHWVRTQTVAPQAGRFEYRAAEDGELWFAVRAVGADGAEYPPRAPQPELRVVLDTRSPTIDVQAARGKAGELHVRWKLHDPHVSPDAVSLEYQAQGQAEWRPLALTPAARAQAETTLWLDPPGMAVSVRVRITDFAGNPGFARATVEAFAPARPAATSVAEAPPAGPSPPQEPIGTPTPWPIDRTADRPAFTAGTSAPADRWRPAATPGAGSLQTGPLPTTPQPQPLSAAPSPRQATPLQASPLQASPVQPPVASPFTPPAAAGERPNLIPADSEPQWINSLSFELPYELESADVSQVSRVELWSTADGGRRWALHVVDEDRRSPVAVSVPAEGIYGFRIVIHGAQGQSERPPQPGDAPDHWLAVDLTSPKVRLLAVEPRLAGGQPEVRLAWQSDDAKLGDRPVSLSYSRDPSGPWVTIAVGLDAQGSHVWRPEATVQGNFYYRLEVRDAAGNAASDMTPQPLIMPAPVPAGPVPTGR